MNQNFLRQTKKCFLCGNKNSEEKINNINNIIYCEKCGIISYTEDFFCKYISKDTGLLLIPDEIGYLSDEENNKYRSNLSYYFKSAKLLNIEPIALSENTIGALNEFKDMVELSFEKILEPLAIKISVNINKNEIQKNFHEMIKTIIGKI
jgi:hypothetical protein